MAKGLTFNKCVECDKRTIYWNALPDGNVLCADCLGWHEGQSLYPVSIGDTLLCLKTQGYTMGQSSEDQIPQGSLVTVDRIEPNGRLGFTEHADRYGFWDRAYFRKA